MSRFFIYRTNHVEGRQPLNVMWADSAQEALAKFNETDHLASTGTFVAEVKCRKVFWWLY